MHTSLNLHRQLAAFPKCFASQRPSQWRIATPCKTAARCSAVRSDGGVDFSTMIRQAGVAAVLSLVLSSQSCAALALETPAGPTPIYFGNGCFWGRQKDYVDAEMGMGRAPEQVSAVVGYAGGKAKGSQGQVCYYYGPRDSVYERLGHAEVVQLQLDPSREHMEFSRFADVYFSQFRRTGFGMLRLDPQDFGPGYRNVIGIPGGANSPLFSILQERNVHKMKLVAGDGNEYVGGKATEGDTFNTVYVVDSDKLPFHQAEVYHQFHNGIGAPFPAWYTTDLKSTLQSAGRITSTGCPELQF